MYWYCMSWPTKRRKFRKNWGKSNMWCVSEHFWNSRYCWKHLVNHSFHETVHEKIGQQHNILWYVYVSACYHSTINGKHRIIHRNEDNSHCLYVILNTKETNNFYWQWFHILKNRWKLNYKKKKNAMSPFRVSWWLATL